jgi:hypothetical protein
MSVEPGPTTTFGLTRIPVNLTLSEQVIPGGLPPGNYQLHVVLHDKDTVMGPDGLSRPERVAIIHVTEPFEVR